MKLKLLPQAGMEAMAPGWLDADAQFSDTSARTGLRGPRPQASAHVQVGAFASVVSNEARRTSPAVAANSMSGNCSMRTLLMLTAAL